MKQKCSFLCGNFENMNYIYAIKVGDSCWHYFEEIDSVSTEHNSLPSQLDVFISNLKKIRKVQLFLDEEKSSQYYCNQNLVFKGKELKTCKYQYSVSLPFSFLVILVIELADIKTDKGQSLKSKSLPKKTTTRLILIAGQTNPCEGFF